MREFVREKPAPVLARRRILICAEDDIVAHCVSQRIHRTRRCCRVCIGVHANLAEVMAEARLHETACGGVERLAGRAQHLADDGRHSPSFHMNAGMVLPPQAFLAALLAFAGRSRDAAAGAFALERPRQRLNRTFGSRSSDCRVSLETHRAGPPYSARAIVVSGQPGHPIRLLLELIVRFPDLELGPDHGRARRRCRLWLKDWLGDSLSDCELGLDQP